jgi:hypothetical protein
MRSFRNLPWEAPKIVKPAPRPPQDELDAAWREAGGKFVPFKIICRTCRLGPAAGVEVFKCDDGSWRCEVH